MKMVEEEEVPEEDHVINHLIFITFFMLFIRRRKIKIEELNVWGIKKINAFNGIEYSTIFK